MGSRRGKTLRTTASGWCLLHLIPSSCSVGPITTEWLRNWPEEDLLFASRTLQSTMRSKASSPLLSPANRRIDCWFSKFCQKLTLFWIILNCFSKMGLFSIEEWMGKATMKPRIKLNGLIWKGIRKIKRKWRQPKWKRNTSQAIPEFLWSQIGFRDILNGEKLKLKLIAVLILHLFHNFNGTKLGRGRKRQRRRGLWREKRGGRELTKQSRQANQYEVISWIAWYSKWSAKNHLE